MRILPGVLKELLKHVPTVLFDVIHWSELASELPKLSRKLLKGEGYSDLFSEQQTFLGPYDIHLKEHVTSNIGETIPARLGEKFLTLYFAQLFSPHGIFLDLRPNHFEIKDEVIQFAPSGLWVRFDKKFRQGLLELYEGFYTENDDLYYKGLITAGLMSEHWPLADKQKLADLFKAQFGNSISGKVRFTLEGFKTSMIEIADFLLVKKVKMSNDFLYLGVYLVTLYSVLEKCEAELSVREVYLQSHQEQGQ